MTGEISRSSQPYKDIGAQEGGEKVELISDNEATMQVSGSTSSQIPSDAGESVSIQTLATNAANAQSHKLTFGGALKAVAKVAAYLVAAPVVAGFALAIGAAYVGAHIANKAIITACWLPSVLTAGAGGIVGGILGGLVGLKGGISGMLDMGVKGAISGAAAGAIIGSVVSVPANIVTGLIVRPVIGLIAMPGSFILAAATHGDTDSHRLDYDKDRQKFDVRSFGEEAAPLIGFLSAAHKKLIPNKT